MQTQLLYAIISPINEVIFIKRRFDWLFYKNNELIEEYHNKLISKNIFEINDTLKLYLKDKKYILEKIDNEYKIIFNFTDKICLIELLKENLKTEINLLSSEIIDKGNKITIIYMLEETEINKLVINLKE